MGLILALVTLLRLEGFKMVNNKILVKPISVVLEVRPKKNVAKKGHYNEVEIVGKRV